MVDCGKAAKRRLCSAPCGGADVSRLIATAGTRPTVVTVSRDRACTHGSGGRWSRWPVLFTAESRARGLIQLPCHREPMGALKLAEGGLGFGAHAPVQRTRVKSLGR
jgi:hypothetical protein